VNPQVGSPRDLGVRQSRPTFVFVDVSMFKEELIFFTRFTFFYEGDINENILE
jgi:hypothetical protein